jgi:hypothetical protein
MKINKVITGAVLSALALTANAAPTNQEIFDMMQEMKAEIKSLKKENSKLKGTVEEVAVATDEAIKAQVSLFNKTTLGGYGELHYNNLDDQKGTSDTDKIDFHRFVLFVNHEYNDKLRFVSELELEHSIAGEGKAGEIELEQAYIQYDVTDSTSISAGLFIIPVGIMNETHEPPTFYGVERNPVEKNIVPATWWEGGAMITTEITDGLTLDLAGHSGLKATDGKYKPRDGRQKVGSATAKTGALTTRLKYTAIPGLELAGTINYQEDYGQELLDNVGSATLYEAHAVYNYDQFSLRALGSWWDIDGSAVENVQNDLQYGFYVEPSFRFNMAGEDIGIFARYNQWDNQAGDDRSSVTGVLAKDTKIEQIDIGVNWWIDKDVVVKVDYQDQSVGNGTSKELDGINVGIGYQF